MQAELCRQALRSAAASFRLGMEAQANEAFVAFIDALSTLFGTPEHQRLASELNELLGHILAAQQRGDPLSVADLLEYELAPRLP